MKRFTRIVGTAALLAIARPAHAGTLQVGPGKTYSKPCAAFAVAGQGDTIEIDAAGNGTYDGDVCAIAPANLIIRGVNGRAHVDAAGNNAQGKAIWVVQGNGITIENVELSGASVVDHNGAGIRAEGTGLIIRNCYFHDNEEGILGGAGEVLIELSEFARNGNCIDPSGCAHNMYLSNSVTKFTLRYSYTHTVTDGHLVKSRAQTNYIIANRITGESGTDSYEIDFPNAGTSYVIGNLIEQSASTGNPTIVTFGEEGASNAGKDLYVVNNTFVNDRGGGGTFVNVDGSITTPAVVKNNIFLGTGTTVSQATAVLANNFTGNPMLLNRAGYDYHLLPGSPCINAGADPGSGGGFSLTPVEQYVHPANFEARSAIGVIDIGAYEFAGNQDGGTAGTGGSSSSTGGASGTGGSTGGSSSTGGNTASGGAPSTGGATSTPDGSVDGSSSNGGSANGGTGSADSGIAGLPSGGSANGGTNNASSGGVGMNGGASGASSTGGARSSGGRASGNGGSTGGGATSGATDAGAASASSGDEGGCGCRAAERSPRSSFAAVLVAVAALARRRRPNRRALQSRAP